MTGSDSGSVGRPASLLPPWYVDFAQVCGRMPKGMSPRGTSIESGFLNLSMRDSPESIHLVGPRGRDARFLFARLGQPRGPVAPWSSGRLLGTLSCTPAPAHGGMEAEVPLAGVCALSNGSPTALVLSCHTLGKLPSSVQLSLAYHPP